jgi:hypothetical protein
MFYEVGRLIIDGMAGSSAVYVLSYTFVFIWVWTFFAKGLRSSLEAEDTSKHVKMGFIK